MIIIILDPTTTTVEISTTPDHRTKTIDIKTTIAEMSECIKDLRENITEDQTSTNEVRDPEVDTTTEIPTSEAKEQEETIETTMDTKIHTTWTETRIQTTMWLEDSEETELEEDLEEVTSTEMVATGETMTWNLDPEVDTMT